MLEPSCCCAPAAIRVGLFQVPSRHEEVRRRGTATARRRRPYEATLRARHVLAARRTEAQAGSTEPSRPNSARSSTGSSTASCIRATTARAPFTKSLGVGVEKRPLTLRASVNGPSIATDSTDRLGRPALITEPAPSVMTGPGRRPLCKGSVTSTIADATASFARNGFERSSSPRRRLDRRPSGMAAVTDRSIDSPRANTRVGAPTSRAVPRAGRVDLEVERVLKVSGVENRERRAPSGRRPARRASPASA